MATVTYIGGRPRLIRHPDGSRYLTVGESFEAPDLWVRQHTALVLSGELEVEVEPEAPKPKKPKKITDG